MHETVWKVAQSMELSESLPVVKHSLKGIRWDTLSEELLKTIEQPNIVCLNKLTEMSRRVVTGQKENAKVCFDKFKIKKYIKLIFTLTFRIVSTLYDTLYTQ